MKQMKIVIAPDSFKESLTALEVAEVIAKGFRSVFTDAVYVLLPIADGGEGTVSALVAATGGTLIEVPVTGPLGDEITGFFGLSADRQTAFIEMAAASGLALVAPDARNPLLTTSRGTGELILAALNAGVREMVVGIGGSATNDGGAGMLQALGVRLLDGNGREVLPGGGGLETLAQIDSSGLDPRLLSCRIQVACDVDNPLIGPRGASAVFGPQKGATAEMVARLDRNLEQFGTLLEQVTGTRVNDRPGAGAAGGMGAALLGLLNAQLRPGVDIVIEAVHLEEAVANADLVITGEGKLDGQTASGKAPAGVAKAAARYGVPVIGIGGSLGADLEPTALAGFAAMFAAVSRPCLLEAALAEAEENLLRTSSNIAALLRLGMQLHPSEGDA